MGISRSLESIRFGVEIEFNLPKNIDNLEFISNFKPISGWEIVEDPSTDNGAELRPKKSNKLYFNEKSMKQIKRALNTLKKYNASVDGSCGGHVHVDMSKFLNKEIVKIFKSFYKSQDLLIEKFQVKDERLECHTQRLDSSAMKLKIARISRLKNLEDESFYGTTCLTDKAYLLNIRSLSEHGTLEFRLFNGTLSFEQWKYNIKYAIEFCLSHCK
jgi:hypothetical protein